MNLGEARARPTHLQARIAALSALLLDARDNLDDEAYSWFVGISTQMVGSEAARLLLGEALRTQRSDESGQAA